MKQDIEKLLERYYDGETSLEDEKLLRHYFQSENVPAHLQPHAGPFRYFAAARDQHPSAEFNRRLAEKLSAGSGNEERVRAMRGRVVSLTAWSLRLAASVALLIVGFAGGLLYNRWQAGPADEPVVASSDDTRSALTMKRVLAFGQQPKTSASERIQAVNQSYELTGVDQAITQLLINTLNFDPNVNVRLAACQALLRFGNEPGVREALIQSLQIQTDPNAQIMLIDALVAIKEKRAVTEIQRLARRQQILDAVRLRAEESISRLEQDEKSPS